MGEKEIFVQGNILKKISLALSVAISQYGNCILYCAVYHCAFHNVSFGWTNRFEHSVWTNFSLRSCDCPVIEQQSSARNASIQSNKNQTNGIEVHLFSKRQLDTRKREIFVNSLLKIKKREKNISIGLLRVWKIVKRYITLPY